MEYIPDKEQIFEDFTVQGQTILKSGKRQPNPRIFKFESKKGKGTGYSIKAKKVLGLGKKLHIEVALYGQAMREAKALKLTQGDRITVCGFYEVREGKTQTFHKVSVNDEMQIERFTSRAAKHSEL